MATKIGAPAFGAVHSNASSVKRAFLDGEDFILMDPFSHGRYFSIRDLKPGEYVELRYGRRMEKVTIVEVR